ncbi:MAG: hypothetical protein KatS3mg008_1918 [Acidimicrobiales bacterium]|nr:MAG: hypothetical protein KatS3mg008_1918 [Acidimicrobiales bacterium]
MLRVGRIIRSERSDVSYHILEPISQTELAGTWRAERLGRRRRLVCVKATRDDEAWSREIYFSRLTSHPRVLPVVDHFPVTCSSGGRRATAYCIVRELADGGDLVSWLSRRRHGLSPSEVVSQVRPLAGALGRLHRGGVAHGDLAPTNVLVLRGRLVLADFGLAHLTSLETCRATRKNAWWTPSGYIGSARDDVWALGQFLAVLHKGDATRPLRSGEIRRLGMPPGLEELVLSCTGPASGRPADAGELHGLLSDPDLLRS